MKLFTKTILLLLFSLNIYSQNDKQDPFHGNYVLGSSAEVLLFWNFGSQGSKLHHKTFNYYGNSGQYFIDSSAQGTYSESMGIYGHEQVDAVSGDFNGDGLDEIVSVWEGENLSLNIVIPHTEKGSLTWNSESMINLPNVLTPNSNSFNTISFRLVKGYFDNDPNPEFAIMFWNTQDNLELRIFDVNEETLVPVEKAAISDEYMNPAQNNSGLYDISAGDFDGDLIDEIALVAYEEISQSNWSYYIKIYNYVDSSNSGILESKVRKENYFSSNDFFDPNHRINNLAIATGDFTNNTIDEIVVDFVLYDNSSETYNYLLPGKITSGLDSVLVNHDNLKQVFQTLGESYINIGVKTADFNNDGRDEILVDGDGRIRIYDIDDNLQINGYVSNNLSTENNGRRRMTVADLNASSDDSTWHPEVIVSSTIHFQPDNSNHYTTFNFTVFEPIVDASGDLISLQKRASEQIDSVDASPFLSWVLTAGDFDGGSVRLGTPKYFSATDIIQPLVILNAPPTHFDVINDSTFDVNKSYNGQANEFYSTYFTESETNIEFETELHTAWTIGAKVSGTVVIPKVYIPVTIELEAEYGKDFSKVEKSSNTYRVSQNIHASNDDYVYATIVDYDIWEYPIFEDGEITSYSLVVSPQSAKRSWFPSKSPQASDYIPNHEVGNILSYNQIAQPIDNSSLQTIVKWNTSDEITLDGSQNFNYNWSLENETQTEVTETNEVHWSVGAKISFDIPFKYIPNFELSADYSSETISTRRNTVKYKKGLDVNLGPIDLGIGETYYSVTPYAYWAKSGALVLDYAVNPRPSGINVPETWWQTNYSNKPDPALILPWRLDPEKGISITDDKRQQTKEIIFNPEDPAIGETINIKARIHNYSLLNTNGPVTAQFYLGDPANGGTLIESNDGKTIFSTDDFIEARESKIISFDWTLPSTITTFPRIYIVLDPLDQIDEIHETNNIGWKVLPISNISTDVSKQNEILSSFELSQNYPNPFNPSTTIKYSILKQSNVILKVFDVLGREVKLLVNKVQPQGTYEIKFNANNLTSGVYFYRIQAGNFIETKKMILLR